MNENPSAARRSQGVFSAACAFAVVWSFFTVSCGQEAAQERGEKEPRTTTEAKQRFLQGTIGFEQTPEQALQAYAKAKHGKVVPIVEPVHLNEKDLGVPLYPGATWDARAGASFEVITTGLRAKQFVRVTKDSPEKVKAFYEPRTPGWAGFAGTNRFSISGDVGEGRRASIHVEPDPGLSRTRIIYTVVSSKTVGGADGP